MTSIQERTQERIQERWSGEQVLTLAPDAASAKAAGKLAAAASWPALGAAGECVWGQCRGSGSKPYQTVVDLRGPAYSCSCPSRKFPCKHALALLLLWSRGEVPDAPAGQEPADWAQTWLAGRRERARGSAGKAEGAESAEGAAGEKGGADPEAARRRSEQRLRRIEAGVAELEQRLADILREGLAAAPPAAVWEEAAARMVDAQAPGLAARVRELAALPASGPGWPSRFLAEASLLHLLGRGFLGREALPEPLAATVRARVGLTTDAARLLAGDTVREEWLVLAQEDQDDGRLVTRRIWLYGRGSGRFALLLSYGGGGRAPEVALPTGVSIDAELAFYPGAHTLRATLGERFATSARASAPSAGSVDRGHPRGVSVDAAIRAYAGALARDPWLDSVPVVLSGVVPIPGSAEEPWQLAHVASGEALPVDARATGLWQLLSVSGGAPLTVFGELGHAGFRPLTTWSGDVAVVL
ncbi:SWIM zinc finger family protein [Streptomyces polyrhachis]|uniref:SWIM zinc finger family protein n=1 Tax=Streptomyces polyrhachis TaxID=1282885 RepID=A0ABW2G9I4_9ACTN